MSSYQTKDATFKGLLGFLSGLALSYIIFGRRGETGVTERGQLVQSASKSDIFSLLVTLKFDHPKGIAEFHKLFAPYAEWVAENEPATTSYQLLQHDSKPLEVMVLERYINKDAYLNIHRKTIEFASFKERFLKLQDAVDTKFTVSGNSYNDTPFGYM